MADTTQYWISDCQNPECGKEYWKKVENLLDLPGLCPACGAPRYVCTVELNDPPESWYWGNEE